jgi:acetyl-CoA synthetase
MTTFQDTRAFLLRHRTDYDAAVKGFRWPDPTPFNWALDWFDAGLARDPEAKDRTALWIVDAGHDRETKLSFAALSRCSNQVANHAGRDEARCRRDSRNDAADAG